MNSKEQTLFDAVDAVQKAFYDLTGNEDAFNYNRLGEVMSAIQLGLDWNSGFSGADAFDSEGNPVELKSTTQSRIQGTYNGLSKFDRHEEFVEYIQQKYPDDTRHIFTRKVQGKIVEAYELPNNIVLDIILAKTGKVGKFWDEEGFWCYKGKDPRVGCSVSMTEIKKNGTQLI